MAKRKRDWPTRESDLSKSMREIHPGPWLDEPPGIEKKRKKHRVKACR